MHEMSWHDHSAHQFIWTVYGNYRICGLGSSCRSCVDNLGRVAEWIGRVWVVSWLQIYTWLCRIRSEPSKSDPCMTLIGDGIGGMAETRAGQNQEISGVCWWVFSLILCFLLCTWVSIVRLINFFFLHKIHRALNVLPCSRFSNAAKSWFNCQFSLNLQFSILWMVQQSYQTVGSLLWASRPETKWCWFCHPDAVTLMQRHSVN